jgi:hypothetical protein
MVLAQSKTLPVARIGARLEDAAETCDERLLWLAGARFLPQQQTV